MSFSVEVSFNQVLEDCISGKLLKEQALELLENKYKTAYVDIKQKFGRDRQSFCCYGKYDFDEWIEICDDTERNKPFHERKHSDAKIQRVINKYTAECKKDDLKSKDCIIDVYSEVHQIQNWCRENRETKELYEIYKAKIEDLSNISIKQKENIPEKIIHILLDHIPPKVKKHEQKNIETKNKIIPEEYWILTTVEDVKLFLEEKQTSGEIKIVDIQGFMKTYLKGKKGGDISASFRVEKCKNRKKI